MPGHFDDESGQTSVLILGVMTIVLMLSAVIIGVTTVNLAARQVLAEADGAASAAAHTAQSAGVGPEGLPGAESGQVAEAVQDHLQNSDAYSRHENLTVIRAWASPTGQTVHVELGATAQLPVLSWVLPAEVDVTGSSHARVTVHR